MSNSTADLMSDRTLDRHQGMLHRRPDGLTDKVQMECQIQCHM